MRDFTNTKMPSANDQGPRLQELVETVNLKDGKSKTLRIIGPMTPVPVVWIPIHSPKTGKKTSIPKISLQYNPETGEIDDTIHCPYIEAFGAPRASILVNVINRQKQDDAPAKMKPKTSFEKKKRTWFEYEAFYKESVNTDSFTPCEVLVIPVSAARKIQDLVETNKKKIKNKDGEQITKTFGPDHPKHGFDVIVRYDKTRPPAEQYIIQKGESSSLTEEELDYLLWQYNVEKPDSLAEAKKNVQQLKKIFVNKENNDSDDVDDDDDSISVKNKSKKSSKFKEDFDEDDDADESVTKSSKKKKSFDDADDFDDEDDDEDSPPVRKKSKKKIDDEDEEEEEESPKKKKKLKKSVDEDEEW